MNSLGKRIGHISVGHGFFRAYYDGNQISSIASACSQEDLEEWRQTMVDNISQRSGFRVHEFCNGFYAIN